MSYGRKRGDLNDHQWRENTPSPIRNIQLRLQRTLEDASFQSGRYEDRRVPERGLEHRRRADDYGGFQFGNAYDRVRKGCQQFEPRHQPRQPVPVTKAMVYARAVWVENGMQMEGVLPLNWIETETKVVRWPLKNVSVAHERLLPPQEDWLSFELVKVKVTSVSRQECEKYNYTSAQTEEEDTVSQKRMKKRRTLEDYVQGSDLSPEEDEFLPDKKKVSGCSRPTTHRSPTRAESSEAFSPESARSRRSRTPQRGFRKPSQSGSRKGRASSSRFRHSWQGRHTRGGWGCFNTHTFPGEKVAGGFSFRESTGRFTACYAPGSRTPQRGVRKPSQSRSRKGRASSSKSRRSRTPQRGVRKPSRSGSRKEYRKSVLGKLVELLDEIKRVGRHYEPLNSAVHVARLETLEDFAEEEAHLKDRNLWEQRVSQLSKVGGRNNKDCVHKVMDRLFTNSLMAAFNMKGLGRSEKKAFQDTVHYSVVKAAVMKWSKTATEVEIRAAIAETLKHAPGRAGGGGRKV
ncbi:hypothetical protein DPEC_G00186510 [Dallia pectoralis]|uniref:Uncharacterized protein n=1 Tax=Dallia pectoralis TaxID=75939 RepID=A0ACC2GBI4_DALPE|nr:hypothetical protein DPEC_G00186510 [Dallia pectoralis]